MLIRIGIGRTGSPLRRFFDRLLVKLRHILRLRFDRGGKCRSRLGPRCSPPMPNVVKWVSNSACAIVFTSLGLVSCAYHPSDRATGVVSEAHRIQGAKATRASIFDSDQSWVDDLGVSRSLSDYRGKTLIVAFFFTKCDLICPMTVERMKWIERRLSTSERRETQFLLISMDPSEDTPQRLQSYRERHHLAPAQWTLLTGDRGQAFALASAMGVPIAPDGSGGFRHSSEISVVDAAGYLVEQRVSLQEGVDEIADAVRRLATARN